MIGRSGYRPKTCWLCCDFLACWYGKVGVEGGFFIGGDNAPMCLMCRHMSGRAIGLAGALSVRESSWPRCTCCLRSSPPANGGNCTNRDTTRRRHAGDTPMRMLLMVQNPHHSTPVFTFLHRRHAPSLVQHCPARPCWTLAARPASSGDPSRDDVWAQSDACRPLP